MDWKTLLCINWHPKGQKILKGAEIPGLGVLVNLTTSIGEGEEMHIAEAMEYIPGARIIYNSNKEIYEIVRATIPK